MLCIQWTPSETDGLIHRGGGEDIRDPDLSEAPESSQEGPLRSCLGREGLGKDSWKKEDLS